MGNSSLKSSFTKPGYCYTLPVHGALKLGVSLLAAGVVALIASFIGGFGPCGPSTLLGLFLMLSGALATGAGSIITVVGLIAFANRRGSNKSSTPGIST